MEYIGAHAVATRLDYHRLIDALRTAFAEGVTTPRRSIHAIPSAAAAQGSLLCMPAWHGGDFIVVKLVTAFEANARRGLAAVSGVVVVFDAKSGQPIAVCDGTELTRRRTAAASALAASYLARPDARTLTVIGSGALAPHMAEAFCAVRSIDTVRVWGRTAAKAEAVCGLLEQRVAADVRAVRDLEQAVRSSDIVSCCTSATMPVLLGSWLSGGMHVDAVGSYLPQMREVDDEVITRSTIFVDRIEDALEEAGDILIPLQHGLITRDAIKSDLHGLASGALGRARRDEITFFKSVGSALEDLAAARCLLAAA